jgi:catechol 2,3-dioxygenase-like lactoylglutathione lyase family enzyme
MGVTRRQGAIAMTAAVTGRIHLITIPSTDTDRSIAFYERLGFEKRADFPFGDGGRWVELFPPDGTAGLSLAAGADAETGARTGVIVTTDDIDAAHARLRALGVDVDGEIARPGAPVAIRVGAVEVTGPRPAMFHLRDPDGNELLMVGPA